MAAEYSLMIEGQPYFASGVGRTIQLFYTEPEEGVKPDTGILLLISGFEGDTGVSVYQKMRREFSDRENLVVVQCDFFGYEFMGSETMRKVFGILQSMAEQINERRQRGEALPEEEMIENLEQEESRDGFCELGIFQALDNLRAVRSVMELLNCRGCEYNKERIIAYGYSHGAYLALLCNALAPDLFSGIIDNSGWMYPVYLYRPRICNAAWNDSETGESKRLFVMIHYKGRQWIDDMEIYHLRRLYSQFENQARILSFHGEDDGLVPLREKSNFIAKVENACLVVIRKEDVDEKIFYNTQHGMGSDFLRLFYFVTSIDKLEREEVQGEYAWKAREFSTRKYRYRISEKLEITRIER